MLNFTYKDLKTTAEKTLELRPDPMPRFHLLRDVLQLDPASTVYRQAQANLRSAGIINLLESSQQLDGTWGRFHTQDTKIKQPFICTEAAIAAALASGLDKYSPILVKTQAAIVDYVNAKTCWPDPPEKHDNPLAWFVWVRHYSAAVLSKIDRHHPRLDEYWKLWVEAMEASFHSGIYYVYHKTISMQPSIQSKSFWGWSRAHQLLSRFRLWGELAEQALNWIWAQRNEQGFWDLGSKVSRRPYSSFPLSESWKRPENRIIDCSVEMLTLLGKGLRE